MLTASRPFDKERDGFVMGEGAGALIVEDLELPFKRRQYLCGDPWVRNHD